MTKQNQTPLKRGPAADRESGTSGGGLRAATLAGVAILIAITGMNLYETRRQKTALDDRLTLLENQVAGLGTRMDAAAKAAQPRPQQGPDPNKVYTVRAEGAPVLGPRAAPITIAEISDFQ